MVYSIVCAMRSQVGVYHNHIGTTALCVGIYRAHTVYAVIANGRANNFLFPRSERISRYTDTFTDGRALLSSALPERLHRPPDIVIVFFVFYVIMFFLATTTFIYDYFLGCHPPDYILYYYCRLPKNTVIVIIYNERFILRAVLRWLYIKINENIFRENVS